MYSLYGSWSIEETKAVGQKFVARCKSNYSYEKNLTIDKEYEVEITPCILTMSPLCRGVGDDGKGFQCHLERFEKVRKI